ncbi:COG3400 family protein [Arcobacter sp. FWKO B]|uniref:COG3400 family protein n=1 Tax=Arcobacter sp. FWKO B TaxID=2593672 RepID=UPI0018A4E2F9|nr:potassium transporter TrkA [Arcobacter sp. FWKO B]QOG12517.1 potassium transporter TrkA [Arcobacter sp. FWKO B]
MKQILVILDGIVAKKLLERMVQANTLDNLYDIVYTDKSLISDDYPVNFRFYEFDPTSLFKLETLLGKMFPSEVLVVLDSKDDTIYTIKNIRHIKHNIEVIVYDPWGIDFKSDEHIYRYDSTQISANGLLERLPNIPVVAQNIGLRAGEIMEIKIPFGSSFAYRYIGSIEQIEWKIFGLYRNQKMIPIRPSLILKPEDIILAIGKPPVLMQVYSAISKNDGMFPMPFGQNIFLFIDMYIQEVGEILNAVNESLILHKRLNNKKLIIKIARPTTLELINKIKDMTLDYDGVIVEVDYYNLGFKNIIKQDIKKYNIGLMILTNTLMAFKEAIVDIFSLRIPILKLVGSSSLSLTKSSVVFLNDTKSYEQISPVIMDISSQLKLDIRVFDYDPVGHGGRGELLKHFENLSKIFSKEVKITTNGKNPIRELRHYTDSLQILPLKKDMLKNRWLKIFSTDSDIIAYEFNDINQLLIPIIEE